MRFYFMRLLLSYYNALACFFLHELFYSALNFYKEVLISKPIMATPLFLVNCYENKCLFILFCILALFNHNFNVGY